MNHRYSDRQNALLEKLAQMIAHSNEYSWGKAAEADLREKCCTAFGWNAAYFYDTLMSFIVTSTSNLKERTNDNGRLRD